MTYMSFRKILLLILRCPFVFNVLGRFSLGRGYTSWPDAVKAWWADVKNFLHFSIKCCICQLGRFPRLSIDVLLIFFCIREIFSWSEH